MNNDTWDVHDVKNISAYDFFNSLNRERWIISHSARLNGMKKCNFLMVVGTL